MSGPTPAPVEPKLPARLMLLGDVLFVLWLLTITNQPVSAQQIDRNPVVQAQVTTQDRFDLLVKARGRLDANKLHPGDPISLELLDDLRNASGQTLIPRKARLIGTVTLAAPYVKNGSRAKLSILIQRAEWHGGASALNAFFSSRVYTEELRAATDLKGDSLQPTHGERGYISGFEKTEGLPARVFMRQVLLPAVLEADSKLGVVVTFIGERHEIPNDAVFSIRHLSLDYSVSTLMQDQAFRAVRAVNSAAASGDPQAQFQLAEIYAAGKPLVQNYAKAADWYLKAAEQGLPQAQTKLALLYSQGQGVPKDTVSAHMWLDVAYQRGMQPNASSLAELEKLMSPAEIGQAKDRASAWIKSHPFPPAAANH